MAPEEDGFGPSVLFSQTRLAAPAAQKRTELHLKKTEGVTMHGMCFTGWNYSKRKKSGL